MPKTMTWRAPAPRWRRNPQLIRFTVGIIADEALIDGEAVVFGADGRSAFHALLTKRGGAQATLVAFDLFP
jgi:ATP-dependent DNA ligase